MKKNSTKVLAMILTACLLITGIVGGTMAWLMAKTGTVENVFTIGDIDIDLTESTGTKYKMVPGNEIAKDPTLTVFAQSEDCWLFVEITESDNLDAFITYAVADGWTRLSGYDNVYFREVSISEQNQSFTVLADNKVTVREDVDKEAMSNLTEATYPTLSFTGYAVQRDAAIDAINTAEEAWVLAQQSK